MGAAAYKLIEKYKDLIKGDIVEIGSDRGEGSTQYLSDFSRQNNLNFYSIDFEGGAFQRARNIIGENAYCMKGEDFLDNIYNQKQSKIGAAYLDNFDFIYDHLIGTKMIDSQLLIYKQHGIELNNENSQQAHLEQTKKIIENYIDDFCLIMYDDTYINEALHFDGKGGTAVPFLLKHGWKLTNCDFTGQPAEGFAFLVNK